MLKLLKFCAALLLLQIGLVLVGFVLLDTIGAGLLLILSNLIFSFILLYAPCLLMGQINGKMASSSTHLEDSLVLEAVSRQYRVHSPILYIYNSNQINSYLVKGLLNSSVLAISSECFLSLSLEERGLLYKYQVMRLQFPWHVYIDTSVSILLLFSIWAIDLLFLPINVIRKRIFAIGDSDLQQTLKLIILPFLNFCKNIILGVEKHSYMKSIWANNMNKESFTAIYLKAQQSFFEKKLRV